MHDLVDLLANFKLELPDADEQLFLQHSHTTQTFEAFPKLPLELRHSIWRFTFPPPRHVDLSQGGFRHLNFHMRFLRSPNFRGEISNIKRLKNYLPITLFINRESRQETLRHYRVLPPNIGLLASDLDYIHNACSMPLCLNLKLDTVFFDSLSSSLSGHEMFGWIEYVFTTAPDLLSSIRMLEFRNIESGVRPLGTYSTKGLFLKRFPSMQTLCITLDCAAYSQHEIREIAKDAEQWLDTEYDSSSGSRRNIKVIVRNWEKLSEDPLILGES